MKMLLTIAVIIFMFTFLHSESAKAADGFSWGDDCLSHAKSVTDTAELFFCCDQKGEGCKQACEPLCDLTDPSKTPHDVFVCSQEYYECFGGCAIAQEQCENFVNMVKTNIDKGMVLDNPKDFRKCKKIIPGTITCMPEFKLKKDQKSTEQN